MSYIYSYSTECGDLFQPGLSSRGASCLDRSGHSAAHTMVRRTGQQRSDHRARVHSILYGSTTFPMWVLSPANAERADEIMLRLESQVIKLFKEKYAGVFIGSCHLFVMISTSKRGHPFMLPIVKSRLFKSSSANRRTFSYIYLCMCEFIICSCCFLCHIIMYVIIVYNATKDYEGICSALMWILHTLNLCSAGWVVLWQVWILAEKLFLGASYRVPVSSVNVA